MNYVAHFKPRSIKIVVNFCTQIVSANYIHAM
jgi:hypothetical protein